VNKLTIRININHRGEENVSDPQRIALKSITKEKTRKCGADNRDINVFDGLSIFISCMGLYALVAFSARQRTKELRIRKVLSANLFQLVSLFSASFIRLILFALVIAIPISCYLMQKWLGNFEYQAGISWWIIALTVLQACKNAGAKLCLRARRYHACRLQAKPSTPSLAPNVRYNKC